MGSTLHPPQDSAADDAATVAPPLPFSPPPAADLESAFSPRPAPIPLATEPASYASVAVSVEQIDRSSTKPDDRFTTSSSAARVDTEMTGNHTTFAKPVPVSTFLLDSPTDQFVRPSCKNATTSSISSVTADAGRRASTEPVPVFMNAKTPLRPVRFHNKYFDNSVNLPTPSSGHARRTTFEISTKQMKLEPFTLKTDLLTPTKTATTKSSQLRLQVLVAEDDPVNVKILRKRLEQAGHKVHHTANGQDCAAVYKEKRAIFDVVLMDMEMPIVDGLTSTKMIRAFEGSSPAAPRSSPEATHDRIPIIAVSASLLESDKDIYLSAGLDGWIPKPVNFKRLNILLAGIVNYTIRSQCLYTKGNWEKGGWFTTGGFSEYSDSTCSSESSY